MTYTPGSEKPNQWDKSPARQQGLAPQGLKKDPKVGNPHYPDLGFNPTPGSTETVTALRKKLAAAAKVLGDTHGHVVKLMDGSYWEGDAAVAFREQIEGGPLPVNLKNAGRSVHKAAKQLSLWEGELDEFQRRAKKLNGEAKDARAALDAAKGHAAKAKSNPDLDKKGGRRDDARKTLTRANSHVDVAQGELDRILGRARALAEEHEEKARFRAKKIEDATVELAPHEPGFWDSATDWVSENLPDILSLAAGIAGLAALFVLTGGTAAVVLLLAAAALSLSAAAIRISDPAVWASLKDGFAKGEFDADFWANAVSIGADLAGALPGIGAVGRGGLAVKEGIEAGATLGASFRTFGSSTVEAAKDFSNLRNPVLEWAVESAPKVQKPVQVVEAAAPWAGVTTASYGLASKLVDELDNDTVSEVSTGVDGGFLGLVGVGETIDLARRLF